VNNVALDGITALPRVHINIDITVVTTLTTEFVSLYVPVCFSTQFHLCTVAFMHVACFFCLFIFVTTL